MLSILAWIVWTLLLVLAVSFSFGIARSLVTKRPFSYAILVQTFLFWIMLVLFYLGPSWSKFHILWLTPTVFILGPVVTSHLFSRQPDDILEKSRYRKLTGQEFVGNLNKNVREGK